MTELEKAALNFVRYNEFYKEYSTGIKYTDMFAYDNIDQFDPAECAKVEKRIKSRRAHLDWLASEREAAYDVLLKYLAAEKAATDRALTELVRISEEAGFYEIDFDWFKEES